MASTSSWWEGPVPHKYVGEAKGATLRKQFCKLKCFKGLPVRPPPNHQFESFGILQKHFPEEKRNLHHLQAPKGLF